MLCGYVQTHFKKWKLDICSIYEEVVFLQLDVLFLLLF